MKLAIKEKVPFIYISANSGAKIGLAEDIKQLFKVAWNEKDSPEKVHYWRIILLMKKLNS